MKLGLGLGEARWAGVCVGVLLSACGGVTAPQRDEAPFVDSEPPPGVAALAVSGRRLTALGHASGNAVNFSHFFDEQLRIDCSFQRDAEGTPRCFPEPRSRVVYLDAQCEQRPAVYEEEVSAGQLFVEDSRDLPPSADELKSANRLFEVGELVFEGGLRDDAPTLYQRYGGRCQEAYPNAKAAPAVYLVRPRAVAELVAARLVTSRVSSNSQIRRIVAEDGAELTLGAALADGTPCTLKEDGVCLPKWVDVSTALEVPQAEPVLLGTGPLRVAALELAGGGGAYLLQAPNSTGRFVASDGSSCAISTWMDGSLRCLDEDDNLRDTGYFADAACSVHTYRRQDSSERPLTDALVRRSLVTEWYSGGISAVRSVQRHQGSTYVLREERCSLLTEQAAAEWLELYGELPTDLLIVDDRAAPVELPRIEVVRL